MRHVINPGVEADTELVKGFLCLLQRYSPSCIVSDVMERRGAMVSAIKLVAGKRFAGPALTVHLQAGDLVDCLDALKVARPGDVIVVDAAGDTETSIWGGLMAGLCQKKGVAGAVVDGAVRDVDEIRDMGFGLVARSIVPRGTHSMLSARYDPIEINVPIECGGVLVSPGDIVLADEIGTVVVPAAEAAQVLQKAEEQAEREEATRRRIREGKSVDEILAEFGRF